VPGERANRLTGPARGRASRPFVVAEEFREVLDQKYPKVRHTPWLDVKETGTEPVSRSRPALW